MDMDMAATSIASPASLSTAVQRTSTIVKAVATTTASAIAMPMGGGDGCKLSVNATKFLNLPFFESQFPKGISMFNPRFGCRTGDWDR